MLGNSRQGRSVATAVHLPPPPKPSDPSAWQVSWAVSRLRLATQGIDVGRAQNYKRSLDGCKNAVVPTEAPSMLIVDRRVSERTRSFTCCSCPSLPHFIQALCPAQYTHSPPFSPLLFLGRNLHSFWTKALFSLLISWLQHPTPGSSVSTGFPNPQPSGSPGRVCPLLIPFACSNI